MGTRLGTKLGTRLAASTVWLLLLLGPDTRSAKAGSGTDDAGVDERPSLLIVRSLAPWQEPLYPALTANDRWFCASAARLRCRHRTWLSLPPGREEYHPWFSRFHLAAHALEVAAEHADVVLWLDHDAVFSASAAQVEERLLAWLPGRLERTPLLLAVSNEKGDPVNTPKAFFAANVSAARRVLAALSDYLPREDKPLVPNAKRGSVGTLLHAYAWAGEERAAQFGTAGQLELLEKQQPALATLVGRLPASSVAQDAWLGEGGCALPLPPDWAATAAAVAGEPPAAGELPAEQRPFIASFSCGGEDVAGVVLLARLLRAHNTALGVPPPSAAELAIGGTVVAAADAADRGEAPVDQPPGSTPTLLLIVYGEEYARTRTPVFVRSLLAARTTALHLYVLCDPDGLRAFRLVLREHAEATGLLWPNDRISLFTADASRHVSAMPSLLDPSCHTGGYAYLFYKLFTPELLPAADHLLVIDSDAIVLGDVGALWAELGRFSPEQLVGMAPDQSHRYYFRLSDETDEVYSPGWRNVPGRTGVNGGMMVLQLARMRVRRWGGYLLGAVQRGVTQREAGTLRHFCSLAEQDTINLVFAELPHVWHRLDCAWNYMGTRVGGHDLRVEELVISGGKRVQLYYDSCPNGGVPTDAFGGPGDLVGCACGRRAEILHFAGGTRRSSVRLLLNASIVEGEAAGLVHDAAVRRGLPNSLDQLHARSAASATAAAADVVGPTLPPLPASCDDPERCSDPCALDDTCPDPYEDAGAGATPSSAKEEL